MYSNIFLLKSQIYLIHLQLLIVVEDCGAIHIPPAREQSFSLKSSLQAISPAYCVVSTERLQSQEPGVPGLVVDDT